MIKLIKRLAIPVFCGLLIYILFKSVFFIGYVPTESMEPAIKTGSVIFGYRIIGEIHRGDIVVYNSNGYIFVKRVSAMPGDVVYIASHGKIISINKEFPDAAKILTVPENCYFMLGDNSDNSFDSRMWEDPFIQKNQIIAKIR